MLEQHASHPTAAIKRKYYDYSYWYRVGLGGSCFPIKELMASISEMSASEWRVWCPPNFRLRKQKCISFDSFLLIKIPLRTQGALLPHPSFLSSMVKYVNKMSKVILQRGTKEKRGLREKTAIKFLRFSITLARGGPASSQSLAAGERARSIESHIANPTHKKIKYLFSFSHQRPPPSFHFISYRIISQLLISQRWSCAAFLHHTVVVAKMR